MGLCGGKAIADQYRSEKSCDSGQDDASPHSRGGDSDGCAAKPTFSEKFRAAGRMSQSSEGSDECWHDDAGRTPSMFVSVALETNARRVRLIHDTRGNITDFYALDSKKLGQGAFGYVCKGRSREMGADRAVKALSKARAKETRKRYRQEILIMKMTDHPNIINLFETFEDKQHVYLVMELCTGGDLFERLTSVGRFRERDAAVIMQQILRPVSYMHEKRITHRDIKPENFLFLTKAPPSENTLKLIDFGFSCTLRDDGEMLQTRLGTPRYSSPQVFQGQYDHSCDNWSCGVILYVLLSGEPPFQGKTDAEVMHSVKKGNYAFKGPAWEVAPEEAKDLIRKLLKYQPQERWTAKRALRHPYIHEFAPQAEGAHLLTPSLLMDLRNYCAQSLLRRAALQVVAQQLSQEDTKDFRDAFTALDGRGDGILTVGELKESAAGQRELAEVIEELDLGEQAEGEISFTEFLAATLEARHYLQEGALRAAFRAFDRNHDGAISADELEEVLLGRGSNPQEPLASIQEILRGADLNGDGVIDFEEFRQMLVDDKISSC